MVSFIMDISEKIKMLRIQKNITQGQLAENLGVQRNTITQYESGRIVPPAHNLKKLAEIFFVSIDFLLDDSQGVEARDIPAVKRASFGNSYIDSILTMTVKKITESIVSGEKSEFYMANREAVYKLVETLLYLNVQAYKTGRKGFSVSSEDEAVLFSNLNKQIKEFSKQIVKMESLQRLIESK